MIPPLDAGAKEQRSALLRMMNILDTRPVEELERITRITQSFFEVDSVVISLIDTDRQWSLSRRNFPYSETPLSISFCVHTVASNEPLIIPDARKDPRFSDNPMVTGKQQVRFHASYPLRSFYGIPLGALCLYHSQPVEFTDKKLEQLSDMAYVVQTYLQRVEMQAEAESTRDMLHRADYVNRQIFSQAAIGLVLMTPDKKPIRVNHTICKMLGYTEEGLLQTTMENVTYPGDLALTKERYDNLLKMGNRNTTFQKRYCRMDGSLLWAMVSVALLYNPDGSQHGLLLAITDISNQKASETALLTLSKELEQRVEQRTEELQRSHQFIQDITDHIPAMISCISPDNIFTFANHHLKVLLGSQGDEPINSHIRATLRPKERKLFMPLLDKVRKTRQPVHIEHTVNLPSGVDTTYHTQMVPAEPPAQGVYIFSTDITDLTSLRDQLKFEANHDHLTGLPNRRAVISYLNQLAMKPRKGGLALLFFDLDNFKHYNDHYGHEFGDRVIKTFARILGQNTRAHDLIGRLSGDEFVMVLHERKDMAREVEELSRTLKERIEKPTRIRGHDIVLSASVGIAILGKNDRLDVNHFIHEADTAMYQAKRRSIHSSRGHKHDAQSDKK